MGNVSSVVNIEWVYEKERRMRVAKRKSTKNKENFSKTTVKIKMFPDNMVTLCEVYSTRIHHAQTIRSENIIIIAKKN